MVLETAHGSGLPPQLDTRGTMAELLVSARGSRGGLVGFHRACVHTTPLNQQPKRTHYSRSRERCETSILVDLT